MSVIDKTGLPELSLNFHISHKILNLALQKYFQIVFTLPKGKTWHSLHQFWLFLLTL